MTQSSTDRMWMRITPSFSSNVNEEMIDRIRSIGLDVERRGNHIVVENQTIEVFDDHIEIGDRRLEDPFYSTEGGILQIRSEDEIIEIKNRGFLDPMDLEVLRMIDRFDGISFDRWDDRLLDHHRSLEESPFEIEAGRSICSDAEDSLDRLNRFDLIEIEEDRWEITSYGRSMI